MGEVYRATDRNLGRDVAIKVLPAEVAGVPERLARFEREAKLLASLNHSNIAHVYGFETAALPGGPTAHFLAMELVLGEDLAERLKRGALSADEALAVARQIADALEASHEKGIVHRDLKPANVKLTPDGQVKVLDFGLAKAWGGNDPRPGSAPALSQSPTLAHTGTAAGLILGTAAYMSPEQARGKAVDKRADIWAFGVLLYEMLTGKRLFDGETVSDVLAAVLTREPEWSRLPPSTPPGVERVLRRCLARDPRERLHDIADARIELLEATREPAPPGAPAAGAVSRRARLWRWAAGASGGDPKPLLASPLSETDAAFSADGHWLAYVSGDSLYVAAYPSLGQRVLIAPGAASPRWSRSSSELFYVEKGRLIAMPYEVRGDGFRATAPKVLFELGRMRPVFEVAPDGKRFLFTAANGERAGRDVIRVVVNGFDLLRAGATPEAGR